MRIKRIYETYKFEKSDLQSFEDLNCKIIKGFCVVKNDLLIRYYDIRQDLPTAIIKLDKSIKETSVHKSNFIVNYLNNHKEGEDLCYGYCIKIDNDTVDDNYSEIFREIDHLKDKTSIRINTDSELCIYIKSDKIDMDETLMEMSGLVTETFVSNDVDFELDDFADNWVSFNIYNKEINDFQIIEYLSSHGYYVHVETIKNKFWRTKEISLLGLKIR